MTGNIIERRTWERKELWEITFGCQNWYVWRGKGKRSCVIRQTLDSCLFSWDGEKQNMLEVCSWNHAPSLEGFLKAFLILLQFMTQKERGREWWTVQGREPSPPHAHTGRQRVMGERFCEGKRGGKNKKEKEWTVDGKGWWSFKYLGH